MRTSPAQIVLIHKAQTYWKLSRPVYVELLMESTGVASCKLFTNQGQFERAMAAMEARASIEETWKPLHFGDKEDHWRSNVSKKGAALHADGGMPASSAQQAAIASLMRDLRAVHPRLKGDPEAAFRFMASVMDRVTGGACILQSALTVSQAQSLIGALRRSLHNWKNKPEAAHAH